MYSFFYELAYFFNVITSIPVLVLKPVYCAATRIKLALEKYGKFTEHFYNILQRFQSAFQKNNLYKISFDKPRVFFDIYPNPLNNKSDYILERMNIKLSLLLETISHH